MMQPSDVSVFLKADTEDELIIKMAQNNHKRGAWFPYEKQQKNDGTWLAWYYIDITKERMKEVLK